MGQTTDNHHTIPVYEIFGPTIQGEGLHAGKRCMFVRTCGCNDHCSWCDSKFAWDIPVAESWKSPKDIFNEIVNKGCNTVILTGGNPCLWDFSEFVDLCHEHNINVEVETQGGVYPEWLKKVDLVTFSPKAPSAGSGVKDRRFSIAEWIQFIASESDTHCVIKIPVFNKDDIKFARDTFASIRRIESDTPCDFYLSVGNKDVTAEGSIAETILEEYKKLIDTINQHSIGFEDVAILPQIHTLIWGNKGGV